MISLFSQGKGLVTGHIWRQNENVSREQSEKTWKANDIERTAKVVCSFHNGGLMSDIETDTKPILSKLITNPRGLMKLAKENQRIIANWVILRAMVIDRARQTTFCFIDEEIRCFHDAARKDRKPWPNTHVWMGTVEDDNQWGVTCQLYSRTSSDGAKSIKRFNLRLGEIVIQVFGRYGLSTLGFTDRAGTVDFRKLHDPFWNEYAIRIWPRSINHRSWPPPQPLGPPQLGALFNRFWVG